VPVLKAVDDHSFRAEARAALETAATEVGWVASEALGAGDGYDRPRRRQLDRLLGQRGWAAVAWPAQYGGRGEPLRRHAIVAEEFSRLGVATPYNRVAMGIVAPALLHHGSSEQKARHLPAMITCDEIWCQGFSEPDAGSDLASLRTSAHVDNGEWRVNGQKVWTTLGAEADYCFLLARTGDGAKHRGISALLVPMHQPGVLIRPIKQINGEEDFCEVWFEDARAPLDAVVGEVNSGWAVTMSALSYERSLHLLQRQFRFRKLVDELRAATDWTSAGAAAEDLLVDSEIAGLALAYAMDDQIDTLDRGDALVISLPATSGTGYTWQAYPVARGFVKQIGDPAFERDSTMPGASGHQVFHFGVEGSGSGTLEMRYLRPWEKDKPPAKVFKVTLTVQ